MMDSNCLTMHSIMAMDSTKFATSTAFFNSILGKCILLYIFFIFFLTVYEWFYFINKTVKIILVGNWNRKLVNKGILANIENFYFKYYFSQINLYISNWMCNNLTTTKKLSKII